MNLSVVIPSLNSESEIVDCLDSLVPQLQIGDEVIVVDGGSTDRTLEIASQYGCRIIYAEGAKIGLARHLGVEHAKGDVILQTDTDVVFPSHFIATLKTHYHNHPEVVGVTGRQVDGEGRPLGQVIKSVLDNLFQYGDPITSYRREIYRQTDGYLLESYYGENLDLWIQIRRVGPTIYDPNLWVWHFNPGGIREVSYMIAVALAGLGVTVYSFTDQKILGAALAGLGTGFGLGQLGVDAFSYIGGSPSPHLHHWMIGATLIAGVTSFAPFLSPTWEAALVTTGLGLILHDLLTEPR